MAIVRRRALSAVSTLRAELRQSVVGFASSRATMTAGEEGEMIGCEQKNHSIFFKKCLKNFLNMRILSYLTGIIKIQNKQMFVFFEWQT